MDKLDGQTAETRVRRSWKPPTINTVGTLGEVLQGGGGKSSVMPADPGETRKPTGAMG
jgi:hypothetical protein